MIAEIMHSGAKFIADTATELSGGDVALKGVISVLLIGMLGTVFALCRRVPIKLYRIIEGRLTVSVEFCSNWMGENHDLFAIAGDFVSKHQSKKYLKIFRTRVDENQMNVDVTVSESSGIFFYKGRLVWYRLANAKEQGAVPESLTIKTFGRSAETVLKMIDAESKILKGHVERNFYTFGKEWIKSSSIPEINRKLWLNPKVKDALDKKIDFFMEKKKWFHERSINHKLLIILEGPPGTGKSAISRYVADRLGWPHIHRHRQHKEALKHA